MSGSRHFIVHYLINTFVLKRTENERKKESFMELKPGHRMPRDPAVNLQYSYGTVLLTIIA